MKKETDFIIINPPISKDREVNDVIPYSCLYLAESLIKKRYSIAIFDNQIENIKKQIKEKVSEKTIGFGILAIPGPQLKYAFEISKFIRENYPTKLIILGGARFRFWALPHSLIESNLIDFLLKGEGEQSLPQLLDSIKNKKDISKIKGIFYKKGKQIIFTGDISYTPLNREFNLPFHLLNMEKYARKLNIGVDRCFSIASSRGCPFKCNFCSDSNIIRKTEYIPTESIINNLFILVNKYNADAITILDENFFVNEDKVIEICKALKKANFNIKYRAAGRVDVLIKYKESTLKLLKEIGFVGISVGFESGSQKILDYLDKGTNLKQIHELDEILTRHKFFKSYNFMLGIPTETIDDINKTLGLIINLAKTSKYCPYPFIIYKFVPWPNTKLFDICIKNFGLKIPKTIEGWESFDDIGVIKEERKIRPWMSDEIWGYTNKTINLVNELNNLYIGENADSAKIDSQIQKIQSFMDH